jgi:FkbM family methyltransferase
LLVNFAKRAVRKIAGRWGFSVGKYPRVPFTPVPVFELAVRLLMAAKGTECRFVQVGANDGRVGDAVSGLALGFGWRGILVEPQPDVFLRLQETYAAAKGRVIFENVAVAREAGTLTMYRAAATAADSPFASTVASADPAKASAQLGIPVAKLETISVPCTTLDALLAKHRWAAPDILFIDTEGHDWQVLQSLDFTKHSPLVIQFEHGHLDPSTIDAAIGHLSRHGYQVLYGGFQLDTLCLHADFWKATEHVQAPR